MDNEKKCDKYEALFVFQGEEALHKHLEECEECKKEYEKQLKISALVKEVAPEYLAKRHNKKKTAIKRLAACFIVFVGMTGAYTGINMYNNAEFQLNTAEDSYISTMGLPIDEYGFLEL